MEKKEELLAEFSRIWAIKYARSLMDWDAETYMPEGGAKERGTAQAILQGMVQDIYTSRRFRVLLNVFKGVARSDVEKGIVRVLERDLKFYDRVPKRVVEEFERVTAEAKVVWRRAKKRSDFSLLRPYLERIVELVREMAEQLGYERHPYDALLDLYEEGFRVSDADRLFSGLEPLRSLLKKILDSGWPTWHPLEEKEYNKEGMRSLNREVLGFLGFDENHMRIDVSAHPFTEGIGLYDVRITTFYPEKDFRRSLLAAIHEFGHSLYERQCDPSLWKTPVCGGVSLGIHESQSRFWENIVGRSPEFASLVAPLVRKHLGLDVSGDELFRYFNVVRPSPIRVEADEVTYNLHILLRYHIEKDLVDGSLDVRELPEAWNEGMERYLGIRPESDSEGVLQDIHWSLGYIGYFPTYSIGTVLAAQIGRRMEEEIGLRELIRKGNFIPVREWLRERIHRWGAVYPPSKLLERALGEGLNPNSFVKYIREKYLGG